MSAVRSSYHVGQEYQPDVGEHEGHTVRVIAVDMDEYRPLTDSVVGPTVWVECQDDDCQERDVARWSFVDPIADELAKEGDGWPE